MAKTNPIGTGTKNFPVNGPVDFWAALGRKANRAGTSLGELVRNYVERAAANDDPALAAELREIRRRYYGAAMLLIFCATMFSHDVMRGVRRTRRECESVQLMEVA